jgi:hypothetical protein
MTLLTEQIDTLRAIYPDVRTQPLTSGATLIEIPNFRLPSGWRPETTTIRFLAPAGYPHARPDCFWTDSDVGLITGSPPQASGNNPIPEANNIASVWFSWHVAQWNPNQDSLVTYVRVIEARFNNPK